MFRKTLIAPCGINCGICLAFLRDKNTCMGCREFDVNKPDTVKNVSLSTVNC